MASINIDDMLNFYQLCASSGTHEENLTQIKTILEETRAQPQADEHIKALLCFQNETGEVRFIGQTPLHAASRSGNAQVVALLLQHHHDRPHFVNQRKRDGATALYLAAQEGHIDVARELLNSGGNPRLQIHCGADAVCAASAAGYHEMVRILLESGGNPNGRDESGWTALHAATFSGHLEVVKVLLQHRALVDPMLEEGATPLLMVCRSGHVEIATALIAAGANPNTALPKGFTGVFLAAEAGHHEILKVLIQAGGQVNPITQITLSPLCLAVYNRHEESVRVLLEAGADPNFRLSVIGESVLHLACSRPIYGIIRLLLQFGADVTAQDVDGKTPVQILSQLAAPPQDIIQLLNIAAENKLSHTASLYSYLISHAFDEEETNPASNIDHR